MNHRALPKKKNMFFEKQKDKGTQRTYREIKFCDGMLYFVFNRRRLIRRLAAKFDRKTRSQNYFFKLQSRVLVSIQCSGKYEIFKP